MDQLNVEFINPYNAAGNSIHLENQVAEDLKRGLTTCAATWDTGFSIEVRSDYFTKDINRDRPGDRLYCPISIPLMQREHEVVMGFLLNRLRLFTLLVRKCQDSIETKENLIRGLKRLAENRFGQLGEVIRSCKRKNEAIGASCMHTGVLKAGDNE
jgi:hypothetical protein